MVTEGSIPHKHSLDKGMGYNQNDKDNSAWLDWEVRNGR